MWPEMFPIILSHFSGTDITIRAQALRVVEEYLKALLQNQSTTQGKPEPSHRFSDNL